MIPLALRGLPRPTAVFLCPECGKPQATNYPQCEECYQTLEQYWRVDWQALLLREQIQPGTADEMLLAQLVTDEVEQHPWTCVDWAMTLTQCNACGQELGGGSTECTECAAAFGNALWSEIVAGRRGEVTGNEHALHVGRFVLRHPHRYPENSVTGWRLSMPGLLTGWLPSTEKAQQSMALIKAGRLAEVEDQLLLFYQTFR